MSSVGLKIVSLPGVGEFLILRGKQRLISEHEMAMVTEPRPLILDAGQLALLNDAAAGIKQLISNQASRTHFRSEERVTLVEIERIQIPLHGPLLSHIHDQFRAWRDGQG